MSTPADEMVLALGGHDEHDDLDRVRAGGGRAPDRLDRGAARGAVGARRRAARSHGRRDPRHALRHGRPGRCALAHPQGGRCPAQARQSSFVDDGGLGPGGSDDLSGSPAPSTTEETR